ncbi:MAG TPA: TfoX/Sxy family protein [Xanthomonadaceae bacterium]|jgi:DNA transformation protein
MGESATGFVDYVKDQLSPLGRLASKRFFGGVGLVADGVQFGMVMDDALYFVVDDASRTRYRDEGSRCFRYETSKGWVEVNRYFEVPAQAVEEADQLVALAAEAIAIARRTTRAKPKRGAISAGKRRTAG